MCEKLNGICQLGQEKNRQKNFFLSRSKTQIMWPQIEPKRREVKNDRLSDSNHFIRCLNGVFYIFSRKISSTNWQLGSLQWKYITVKKVNLDYKLADSIMYKSILYLKTFQIYWFHLGKEFFWNWRKMGNLYTSNK